MAILLHWLLLTGLFGTANARPASAAENTDDIRCEQTRFRDILWFFIRKTSGWKFLNISCSFYLTFIVLFTILSYHLVLRPLMALWKNANWVIQLHTCSICQIAPGRGCICLNSFQVCCLLSPTLVFAENCAYCFTLALLHRMSFKRLYVPTQFVWLSDERVEAQMRRHSWRL